MTDDSRSVSQGEDDESMGVASTPAEANPASSMTLSTVSSQFDHQGEAFSSSLNISSIHIAPKDDVLDLCGQGLEKLTRAAAEHVLSTTTLLLDDNCFQRLDNIHTYQCIEKLSAQNNRISRMLQVSKLHHLKILNLAQNNVHNLEGLKELKLLTWLSLASNEIKAIEPLLAQNIHLEHLDLSDNCISHLSDLSYLKNLKVLSLKKFMKVASDRIWQFVQVLLLHKNRISTLKSCERFLTSSVNTLTLNDNQLQDLAELNHLSHLSFLEQFTIADNPACKQPEDTSKQFDYRPYVINWCLSVRVLDGVLVGAKESLKAEWMYSQSKGRQFAVGQQAQLLDYLVGTCPLHPGVEWQEDEKLNLILSKVQEHQSSLRNSMVLPEGETIDAALHGLSTLHKGSLATHPPQRKTSSATPRRGYLSSANSSTTSTPTATPSAPRRSLRSGASSMIGLSKRNSASRMSESPGRGPGRSLTPSSASRASIKEPPGSYNLSLPRTLYGDDVNGNRSDIMTQSCISEASDLSRDPSQATVAAPRQNLMTASLDPSMLRDQMVEANDVSVKAWASSARPSSLFHRDETMDAPTKDVKDVCLQDLSDSEASQSMTFSRLQVRLNPVPESLNSPDIPPPSSNSASRDDPLKLYSRSTMPFNGTGEQLESSNASTRKADFSSSSEENQPTKEETRHRQVRSNNAKNARDNRVAVDSRMVRKLPQGASAAESVYSRSLSLTSRRKPSNKQVNDSRRHQTPDFPRRQKFPASRKHFEDDADEGESETYSESSTNSFFKSNGRRPRSAVKMVVASTEDASSQEGCAQVEEEEDIPPRKKSQKKASRSSTSTASNYSPERYVPKKPRPSSSIPILKNGMLAGAPKTRPASAAAEKAAADSSFVNHSAATAIQKQWRGHATRNNDDRVQHLREEVRQMRMEQHVKHLTKELVGARSALEQERKLRALQMDAMKVIWKEMQMMDPNHSRVRNPNKARPSGAAGSKISSRSSEHSIAKLMETLEATAGPPAGVGGGCCVTGNNSKVSLSSSVVGLSTPQQNDVMAQSTPSFVMNANLNGQNSEAIEALNETCSNLQLQVQKLQSSLTGVMQFMSAFSSLDINDDGKRATRCSSSTSTQETLSVANAEPLESSLLPSLNAQANQHPASLGFAAGADPQPDESALTPMNELPPPAIDSLESRSRSPRPNTLPGLLEDDKGGNNKMPGLAQLAGTALLDSPQAPTQVKAFVKTLVEGLMTDSMVPQKGDQTEDHGGLLQVQELERDDSDTQDSSHLESDSLEEKHKNVSDDKAAAD